MVEMGTDTIAGRIERLSTAAANRVIDPDTDLPGAIGPGQIVPDELLSVHGLGLDLTPEQRATLSREEVAAMLRSGIAFEAVLNAGFSMQIASSAAPTDPRITFLLHEIGEETRHQRMFQRVLRQLDPQAEPTELGWFERTLERVGPHLIVALPALLHTLVARRRGDPRPPPEAGLRAPRHRPVPRRGQPVPPLGGGAAPLVRPGRLPRGVGRRRLDRPAGRASGRPLGHRRAVPLPRPARCVRGGGPSRPGDLGGCPAGGPRVALRHEATRPVLRVLLDAGVFGRGGVSAAWQQLCGVDAVGRGLPPS